MIIKGVQIKVARALLGWSQADLANVSHLSQSLIARMESGSEQTKESTLMLFETINLRQAGIRFINEGDGIVGWVVPKEDQVAQGDEKLAGKVDVDFWGS